MRWKRGEVKLPLYIRPDEILSEFDYVDMEANFSVVKRLYFVPKLDPESLDIFTYAEELFLREPFDAVCPPWIELLHLERRDYCHILDKNSRLKELRVVNGAVAPVFLPQTLKHLEIPVMPDVFLPNLLSLKAKHIININALPDALVSLTLETSPIAVDALARFWSLRKLHISSDKVFRLRIPATVTDLATVNVDPVIAPSGLESLSTNMPLEVPLTVVTLGLHFVYPDVTLTHLTNLLDLTLSKQLWSLFLPPNLESLVVESGVFPLTKDCEALKSVVTKAPMLVCPPSVSHLTLSEASWNPVHLITITSIRCPGWLVPRFGLFEAPNLLEFHAETCPGRPMSIALPACLEVLVLEKLSEGDEIGPLPNAIVKLTAEILDFHPARLPRLDFEDRRTKKSRFPAFCMSELAECPDLRLVVLL